MFEHAVGGGEHRGRDGEDPVFGATPHPQAVELGLSGGFRRRANVVAASPATVIVAPRVGWG